MSEITVKQLNEEIGKCFILKAEYVTANNEKSLAHKALDEQQKKCIDLLTELELTSHKSPHGTFSYNIRESFRVPQNPESRDEFFNFLKEKGVYENLISVNSSTLNTWAKAEIEASDELDYQIPGLEKSPATFKASMRK